MCPPMGFEVIGSWEGLSFAASTISPFTYRLYVWNFSQDLHYFLFRSKSLKAMILTILASRSKEERLRHERFGSRTENHGCLDNWQSRELARNCQANSWPRSG